LNVGPETALRKGDRTLNAGNCGNRAPFTTISMALAAIAA